MYEHLSLTNDDVLLVLLMPSSLKMDEKVVILLVPVDRNPRKHHRGAMVKTYLAILAIAQVAGSHPSREAAGTHQVG